MSKLNVIHLENDFQTGRRLFTYKSYTILKSLILLFFIAMSTLGYSQNILTPDKNVFDNKWLKIGKSEFAYSVITNNKLVEIGTFTIETNTTNSTLSIYTILSLFNATDKWIDTSISEMNTFKPIYRSSFNKNKEFVLHFKNNVTGYYFDKLAQKRTTVKDPLNEKGFDSYTYPYLIGTLPLTTGYKAAIAVYDYKPDNQSNFKKSIIEEVKSNFHKSSFTGDHSVWQVTVLETATNERYNYYIDKDSRRLWKVEIFSNGQHILLTDKETDYNPIKSKFEKAATLKLIKDGNAVITGQAFARDNQSGIKGIAILNINKKQYAKNGTGIVLIPYTEYFKEWIKLNELLRKKGRSVPLTKEAVECIKVATVYDDDGHFEFTSLMPGEYLLFAEFGYVHTEIGREVIGYTDTYVNGIFHGSSERTAGYSEDKNATASIRNIVTIKNDGEKLSIKLKKTL